MTGEYVRLKVVVLVKFEKGVVVEGIRLERKWVSPLVLKKRMGVTVISL